MTAECPLSAIPSIQTISLPLSHFTIFSFPASFLMTSSLSFSPTLSFCFLLRLLFLSLSLFTCKTTAKSTSAGRGATRDKFLSTSKLLSITIWQMECILKLFAHGGHHNSVKSPAPSILCLRLSSCGPSSNPKHAIYAFLIIKLKLLFVFELKK